MAAGNRYIFDANVIVSALLLPGSVPRRAFDKAIRQGRLVFSSATIREIEDVLRRPQLNRYLREEERIDFMLHLLREAIVVPVTTTVTACRDPKDNQYLELAISAQADRIVTGDQDLLVLHPFRGTRIETPRIFLDEP